MIYSQTLEQTAHEAFAFLRRLASTEENGAIVSSQACSVMEITFAQGEGRFWVDPETSCGYVLRMKAWREKAEAAITASLDPDSNVSNHSEIRK